MKLYLLDRSNLENHTFTAKRNSFPYFLKIWHYHPELELVYIEKSNGTRFIGDSIEKFQKGDLVLIGKNLPHMWLNDEAYFNKSSKLTAEAYALHFKVDFLGTTFFQLPEMESIQVLLNNSQQGISFSDVPTTLINHFKNIINLHGFEKTIAVLQLLHSLSLHKSFRYLSSSSFIDSFIKKENNNLELIYEYVFKNFNKPISLNDVADLAHMNPSSFSRFFKKVNRKTFSRYLNEIRIGYACKLLLENKFNINTICYNCGFNNVSNFNRQFKIIKGKSPSEFLQNHNNITSN